MKLQMFILVLLMTRALISTMSGITSFIANAHVNFYFIDMHCKHIIRRMDQVMRDKERVLLDFP